MSKEFIYIGKIVNTHGIKGELRVISNFEKKEKVFKPGMKILIGNEKKEEIILTYRHHKNFEMITLKNYFNINEVLKYKSKLVFVRRREIDLKDNEYFFEDLVGLDIYEKGEKIGKGEKIVYNKANILLFVKSKKNFYIPITEFFVKKVDLSKQIIEVENAKGLIL